ncbi:MAG: vitamin K epoxide reductase family protein [Polyangiaceae bacterium]
MGTPSRDDRWLPASLAAIGFLSSVFLEYQHVRTWLSPSASSFCAVGKTADCTAVALSKWSSFASIPVPIWGIVFFWVLLVAITRRSRWAWPMSVAAALGSVALLLIELLAIGSICLVCELVHMASVALLIVMWTRRRSYVGPTRDETWLTYGVYPACVALLAAAFVMPPYFRVPTWRGELPLPTGKTSTGQQWIGSATPKLIVEEWVDYGCPHCRAASQRTLSLLAKRRSHVRVIRRHDPRMACKVTSPTSCATLRAALCADRQGKFWQMDRWLFAHSEKGKIDLESASQEIGLESESNGNVFRESRHLYGSPSRIPSCKRRPRPGDAYVSYRR